MAFPKYIIPKPLLLQLNDICVKSFSGAEGRVHTQMIIVVRLVIPSERQRPMTMRRFKWLIHVKSLGQSLALKKDPQSAVAIVVAVGFLRGPIKLL